jgi:hypothetical protein
MALFPKKGKAARLCPARGMAGPVGNRATSETAADLPSAPLQHHEFALAVAPEQAVFAVCASGGVARPLTGLAWKGSEWRRAAVPEDIPSETV